jgi:hypothetical protein
MVVAALRYSGRSEDRFTQFTPGRSEHLIENGGVITELKVAALS